MLHALSAGALASALLLGGCARTLLDASVADTHGGTDATAELDFWDGLATQNAISNRDALHALLLTFDLLPEAAAESEDNEGDAAGAVSAAGFEAELQMARQRGWFTEDEQPMANETAQAGWIARAICVEADIKGGVNMRLFGPIPRYALRELEWEGLMDRKSENQALSGIELMATIGRVQDRRTGLVSVPRQDF